MRLNYRQKVLSKHMKAHHNQPIEERYRRITQAITKASQPNESVTLVAVSKTRPIKDIQQLIASGHKHFGENYPQEAVEKITQIEQLGLNQQLNWHFIGRLQSNKTQVVATHFDWIHTIDRAKIVERLAQQRPTELPPLNLCIQINIDQSPQKAGIMPNLSEIVTLGTLIHQAERLTWRGLMCIPDAAPQEQTEQTFSRMYDLFTRLKEDYAQLDVLSMGMSKDFELAIRAGATHVRIGTQLFGERNTR